MIIEPGHTNWKVGFAGDDHPKITFFGAVADGAVGNNAIDKPNAVHPVAHGTIDWTHEAELLALFKHAFEQAQVKPAETKVCVVLPIGATDADKEKLKALLFGDKLGIHEAILIQAAVAIASHNGLDAAMIVDMGDDSTRVVPVAELKEVSNAVTSIPIGGQHVTLEWHRALEKQGKAKNLAASQLVKEKLAYIAMDYKHECAREPAEVEASCDLPDGTKSSAAHLRFEAPEIYFSPPNTDEYKGSKSLAQAVVESATKLDERHRSSVLRAIALSGAPSLIRNFRKRLLLEVSNLLPKQNVGLSELLQVEDQRHAAWVGASILLAMDHALVHANTFKK